MASRDTDLKDCRLDGIGARMQVCLTVVFIVDTDSLQDVLSSHFRKSVNILIFDARFKPELNVLNIRAII